MLGQHGRALALALVAAIAVAFTAGATTLPPEECVRLLRQAHIADLAGDTDGELEHLLAAWESFPREPAVLTALFDRHQRQPLPPERYEELFTALQAGLTDEQRPLPYATLERVVRDARASEASLSVLADLLARRAARRDPADPRLLRLVAELQERTGESQKAFETLQALSRQGVDEELLWMLTAQARKVAAWEFLAELLAPEARRPSAYFIDSYLQALGNLGRADALAGQLDALAGGLTEQESSIGYSETNLDLWTRRAAWQLWDRGQDAPAETLFRRAHARQPGDAELNGILLYLFGNADERAARSAALADHWQQESNPQALLDEGTQRLATGDPQGAFDLLQRAAPAFPDLEAVWYNLGMAAYRVKAWETVVSALRHAGELNPGRAENFYFEGMALYQLERCGEAVAALGRSLELDPERPQAHYYLGACHRRLGNSALAERHNQAYAASQQD